MTNPVFVVEDDFDIARLVRNQLESAGFTVREFHSSASVITMALRVRPLLFVLVTSDAGGFELCRIIRATELLAHTPVIFLSALTSEADRVTGLELGADDYITKPFSPRELVARVRAVLRPVIPQYPREVVRAGDIEIDNTAMSLTVRGEPVVATMTELRLLGYFAANVGRVFSREQLLEAIWHDAEVVTPRSIDVYVRRIREKIEEDPDNPEHLCTVRGAGYKFMVPV